jgi:predicted branched-subunit amino acid permease
MNRIPVVAISVGMATGIYAVSFGALGVTAGLTILETMLLSMLMFSGASQFAFVGVVATGGLGAIPTAIASAWLLGVRNGFYALRMAPVLGVSGMAKLLSAQLTIDESTAVAAAQSDITQERRAFWWTGASVFVFWNLMTLFGALLGDQIGDPANFGLDSAAAAAFLGLVWPRLENNTYRLIAVLAMALAIAISPFAPAGIPVLIGAAVAAIIQIWRSR